MREYETGYDPEQHYGQAAFGDDPVQVTKEYQIGPARTIQPRSEVVFEKVLVMKNHDTKGRATSDKIDQVERFYTCHYSVTSAKKAVVADPGFGQPSPALVQVTGLTTPCQQGGLVLRGKTKKLSGRTSSPQPEPSGVIPLPKPPWRAALAGPEA